jgi:hypothetical protein
VGGEKPAGIGNAPQKVWWWMSMETAGDGKRPAEVGWRMVKKAGDRERPTQSDAGVDDGEEARAQAMVEEAEDRERPPQTQAEMTNKTPGRQVRSQGDRKRHVKSRWVARDRERPTKKMHHWRKAGDRIRPSQKNTLMAMAKKGRGSETPLTKEHVDGDGAEEAGRMPSCGQAGGQSKKVCCRSKKACRFFYIWVKPKIGNEPKADGWPCE